MTKQKEDEWMRLTMAATCLFLAVLAPTMAGATTFSVNFCFEHGVDYEDVGAGEDFWTGNADRTARGIRVRVRRVSDNYNLYYTYTDYNGSQAGCTGNLTLDDDEEYLVRIYTEAKVGTNTIRVRNDPTNDQRFYWTWDSDFVPTSSETITVVTSVTRHWHLLAATGYTQYRRRGGLSNQTYIVYDEAHSSCGTCVPSEHNRVYVSTADTDLKFTIAHEMGHSLARKKNGGASANTDATASMGSCDSSFSSPPAWWVNTKEFQSTAASEGFAEFYSVLVFNDDADSDCFYDTGGSVDWDLDDVFDGTRVNCENGPVDSVSPPVTLDPAVDNRDYLGDMCSGTLNNRATAYDWLRFWWDYSTDHDTYFTDCAAIWNTADPNTWASGSSCNALTCPYDRLKNAAYAHAGSSGADFETAAGLNGVTRN